MQDGGSLMADIRAQRDYMDTVCRSLASRLERETGPPHHLRQFSRRLDNLLELLCTDVVAEDVESAEEALKNLHEQCEGIDDSAQQALNDGQSLLDEMSRPIKDAFGKDISPDYSSQIKYITKKLEELQERKLRCDELADVRKLKLQQILQLRTCEKDADQAIDWILELCDVMVTTHTDMGRTQEEAEKLQEEHRTFESTAAVRYPGYLGDISPLYVPVPGRGQNSSGSLMRWNMFGMLCQPCFSSCDKLFDRIEEILVVISQALGQEVPIDEVLVQYTKPKNTLLADCADTTQMGKALLDRLALPVIMLDENDRRLSINEEGTTDTINHKLRKLDRKVGDLDKYWAELENNQNNPDYKPKLKRTPSSRTRLPADTGQVPPRRKSSKRIRPKPPLRGQQFQPDGSTYPDSPGSSSHGSPGRVYPSSEQGSPAAQGYPTGQGYPAGTVQGYPAGSGQAGVHPVAYTRVAQEHTQASPGYSPSSGRGGSRPVTNGYSGMGDQVDHGSEREAPIQPVSAQLAHAQYGQSQPPEGDDLQRELEESGEWIRVRVHQMEPDLLEVGATLEEALQLRREHDELLSKLQSKEGEVKEMLSRADTYADENRSQADVYVAMADTLSEAWRDLNDKLKLRGQLLDQSIAFHQGAQDLSSKMEQAQSNFSNVPLAKDVETARNLLQQHQEIKSSILEKSKYTLDIGQSLLDRIKEMGMHADLQNRHATTAACYGIEHLLELLHDRRRHLEELMTQRKIRLEQCLHLCQLDQEVNKILEWFRTIGAASINNSDLGDSYSSAKYLQDQQNRFEIQARDMQDTMLRLIRNVDQLLLRASLDAEGVRQRLQIVDAECEDFMVKLDNRRKNISSSVSFFNQAETALTQLGQIEVQLNNMDLPRNSAELAEHHAHLSNAIVEVSTSAFMEGRLLLERVSRSDAGADGVRKKMDELEARCAHLESLCKARRAEAWERSQAYLIFQEKFNSLFTWMTQICQSTLSRHGNMGNTLASAKDFLEIHEQLDEDIREKSAEIDSLSEAVVNLVRSGDQEAQSAAEKVDNMRKQLNRLHRVTETRIQLALYYVSFLRLANQMVTNMSGLEHIVHSETEDLQELTDAAVLHTQEMWNNMSRNFSEFDEKGRIFLKNSSTITDDSTLEIRSTINTVEKLLLDFRERISTLTQHWESWQMRVSSSKQFKSQWHQFVQDARRTIDWVMKVEREFFLPYIAGQLGNSLERAEQLQRKVEEFGPVAKKAKEDIENHLKTAELLSLKGDTKGEKDKIISELVKVHQRFQARINEYQILLKMTITFFKNLHQLDEVISRTEQTYSQLELPSDLTTAESMLEDHKRKKNEVSQLINFSAEEGEKIVRRVRQQDSQAVASEDVQSVLIVTEEYKRRWNQTWDEQQKRLQQNLQICQFNYDLRQIHSEIDELHQHLQARRGSYGNNLPAAKMTSQAFKQFELTVELIEKKISNFIGTAEVMVQDRHYDSVHIRREIDVLKNKWSTFHTSVRDYRRLLDTSIQYFTLIEECEIWMKEGSHLLINIGRRSTECRNPQEANELIRKLEKYVEEGKPLQEQRLQKVSELAVQLYGEQGPNKIRHVVIQYQDLMQSFEQADNELSLLRDNLEGKKEPVEESMQQQAAAPAAAPQYRPPRITQHLKNAEVVEGTKFTFECRVESDTPSEAKWFKDNLPLASPDYETRYENGLATLTIEETFSEDTARYTIRITNTAGTAESSAHLNVKALQTPVFHQPLQDMTVPEGKAFRLEVRFTGSPAPEVQWFRGVDRVITSGLFKVTVEVNYSCLDIAEAFPEDSAQYTVVIKNAAGEARTQCRITIESFYSSTGEDMSQASMEQVAIKPHFTQLLSPTKTTPEGSRVRLDCIIVGHPEPEVIWYHNEKPVKESKDIQLLFEGDRCTLVLREAYLEDSGTYKCVARNDHGQAESGCKLHVEALSELSDASVGEVSPPKFTQLLKDIAVNAGQRVCLQSRVTGHPLPEVQWFKDDHPLQSSPDFQITAFADVHSLTIQEAFEEDSGTYMVKAVNVAGEAKCVSQLRVMPSPEPMTTVRRTTTETRVVRHEEITQAAPEFKKLFQDIRVRPGEPVTFECIITGSPKPKVQWQFNGEPLVSQDYNRTMEGDTYKLMIPEVFDEDAGRFSVTAENNLGKATCSAQLTVAPELPSTEPPTLQIRKHKVRVEREVPMDTSESTTYEEVTRTVTQTETRLERMISEMQDQPYAPSTERFATTITTGVEQQQMIPSMPSHEHFATTITTDLPQKYQPVDLTIEVPVPPKFLQALKTITAMEGTRVIFEGVVTGKPEPSIKWYREGREITQQADFEISYRQGRVTLIIPETTQEDAGQFRCTAENIAGQSSSTAELIVRASMIPPTFTEKLQKIHAVEGEPVRLTVRVAGTPAPQVTWYREGSRIVSSPDFEVIQEGDIHSLYIPEVFYEDAGHFMVRADNPAGEATCSTQLIVPAPPKEKPEPPVQRAPERKPVYEHVEPSRAPPAKAPVFQPMEPSKAPPAKAPVYEPFEPSRAPPAKAPVFPPMEPSKAPPAKAPVYEPFEPSRAPPAKAPVFPPMEPSKAPPAKAPVYEPFEPSRAPPAKAPVYEPFEPSRAPQA
ncbi:uncharacterized protein LOC124264120 [Haliotis rubra]|uniref:uncharacterized protein LOC124264120 n=1 Tax=Haliotis rubra TaxID=36100 RepID=UPI001EE61AFF|nr:uncharacterized protein LOC124264120 [Haliotis rubra]